MSFRYTSRLLLPLLACLVALPLQADTLRTVLQANGVALEAGAPTDLDRAITNYGMANDDELFVIAYYWLGDATSLPDTLRVSLFDKRARSWTHAELPRATARDAKPAWEIGPVLDIVHTRQRLYLDTHINPSAGTLLVLTKDLKPVAALDGWLLAALPDDTVVYHRNEIHFAPTHPAQVWLYQPASGRDMELYPTKPYQPVRSTSSVRGNHVAVNDGGTAVAFVMRFGDEEKRSPAATPALDVLVVCRDLTSSAPRCSEQKLSEVQASHPALSDPEALLAEALRPAAKPAA